MSILVDTNILARTAQAGHSMHRLATDSVAELRRQGETLCLVPQNFYEFWVVCTRPASQNGLGMSPAEAQAELSRLKTLFPLIDDTPAIFPQWEQLVTQHQIQGKNAHDARLVAAMMVHGLRVCPRSPLSPVLRGEGLGVRGENPRETHPLTPTPLTLSTGGEGLLGQTLRPDEP